MAVFTILSELPQPALRAAIEHAYAGRFFHWTDTVSFVRAAGTSKTVSDALGIKTRNAEGLVVGTIGQTAVIQAAPSYWGWSKTEGWEWLKASFEAVD